MIQLGYYLILYADKFRMIQSFALCVMLCLLFNCSTSVAAEKELPVCNDSFISYPLKEFSPDISLYSSYSLLPEQVHEVWQDVFFNKDDKPDRLFIVGRRNRPRSPEGVADEILVLFSADGKDRPAIAGRVDAMLKEVPWEPRVITGESGMMYVSLDTFPGRVPWAGDDTERPVSSTKDFIDYLNARFPGGNAIWELESHPEAAGNPGVHRHLEDIGYARALPGTYDGYPAFYVTLFKEDTFDKVVGVMVMRVNEDKDFEVVCF